MLGKYSIRFLLAYFYCAKEMMDVAVLEFMAKRKRSKSGDIERPVHASKRPTPPTPSSELPQVPEEDSLPPILRLSEQSNPVTTFTDLSQFPSGPPSSPIMIIEPPGPPPIIIQIEDREPDSSECSPREINTFPISEAPTLPVNSSSDAPTSLMRYPSSSSSGDERPLSFFLPRYLR